MTSYHWEGIISFRQKNEISLESPNYSRIRDKQATFSQFKVGDYVEIILTHIEEVDIMEPHMMEFPNETIIFGVISEMLKNAITLKSYKKNESLFQKTFWYDERGIIINEEIIGKDESLHVGNILKIIVRRKASGM